MRAHLGAFVFALLLAVCVGQTPQTGNLTITPIYSGQTFTGILEPTNQANNYHVQLFSIWIPEGTSNATFNFSNINNDECDWLHFFVRSDAPPCSVGDYDNDLGYTCSFGYDVDDGVDEIGYTESVYPGFTDDLFQFSVNTTWYIAVGRYYDDDYTETCPFAVSVTLTVPCGNGSVATVADDDSQSDEICQAYTVVESGNNITFNGVNLLYKLNIPLDTGNVHISVIANDSDISIYASSYYSPSYYTDPVYYSDDWDYNDGTNYYYSLDAYTPRAGPLFIYVNTFDGDVVGGEISFHITQCPLGYGGWNCGFPSWPLNATALNQGFNVTVPYNDDDDVNYLTYGFAYYYWDIPANYYGNDFVIYASSNDDASIFIRRGGYPEDDNYGYEDAAEESYLDDEEGAQYALNQFDYTVPGRIYFGFECEDTPSCLITVKNPNSGTTTTSGSGTTGTTAAATGTTGTTGTSAKPTTTTTTTGTSAKPTTTTTSTTTTGTSAKPTTTTSTSAKPLTTTTTTTAVPITTTSGASSSLSFVSALAVAAAVAIALVL